MSPSMALARSARSPGVRGATQGPVRGKCGPMLGDVSAQGEAPRMMSDHLQITTDPGNIGGKCMDMMDMCCG